MRKQITTILLGVLIILSYSCQPSVTTSNAEDENSWSFVFMTDMHLQEERNAVEGFQQALDTAMALNPEFILTGGDLIMDALKVNYEYADSLYNLYQEVIGSVDVPVYNSVGNHEVFGWDKQSGVSRDHEEFGKKMFEKRLGNRFYSFDHKGWHFIVLDPVTEREDLNGYFGKITDDQIAWLMKDLASVDTSTPLVVSAHFPFITSKTQLQKGTTVANSDGTVITNGKEVYDILKNYNLKLVLQGHLHIHEDLYAYGTHFITAGAVSGSWWKGPYQETEEGFLKVTVSGDEFDTEYVDYGWEADQLAIDQ